MTSSEYLPPSCVLSISSGVFLLWPTPHLTAGLPQSSPNAPLPLASPHCNSSHLNIAWLVCKKFLSFHSPSSKLSAPQIGIVIPPRSPSPAFQASLLSPACRGQNPHASPHTFTHRLLPARECSSTCSFYQNHACPSAQLKYSLLHKIPTFLSIRISLSQNFSSSLSLQT